VTTYQVCTNCHAERNETLFRKRKRGKGRVATCTPCEQSKCPDSHYPPPEPLKPRKPYEPDPKDPEVVCFREELAKRSTMLRSGRKEHAR